MITSWFALNIASSMPLSRFPRRRYLSLRSQSEILKRALKLKVNLVRFKLNVRCHLKEVLDLINK
ncbi:hypothetical protein BpHYR1_044240 [Brachionus plicatilis]|uniref:Uncharacterized protein n=1 Tax=Brachionus plicatilis TaxID=10195 RepID=A0A3M7PJA7_BRAPC|nr:hypothetical protein BpHYR1_044240 [Brachionus plicatilis]